MAFPVILLDAAGSDTAASGAGPGTALTGSAASTDSGGTVVTLDGSPNLTVLAADGTEVIWLNDATTGHRNFSKITAKDNSAKTVTVADAFTGSLSGKSWAIGGKRQTIAGSLRLFDNNSAAGDAMPGWSVEMSSGYTETLSATLSLRRSGSQTDGPITLRGVLGAATPPVLTFSNNGIAISFSGLYQSIVDFEIRNSNATKTSSYALQGNPPSGGFNFSALRIKISHASSYFYALYTNGAAAGNAWFYNCDFGYYVTGQWGYQTQWSFYGCRFHHSQGHGFYVNDSYLVYFYDCLFDHNAGKGCYVNSNSTVLTSRCTFSDNGDDGLFAYSGPINAINCIFAYNGGYGIQFGGGITPALQLSTFGRLFSNNFYTNVSPSYTSGYAGCFIGIQDGVDPQFTNGDYTIGTNLKALGWPSFIGAGY